MVIDFAKYPVGRRVVLQNTSPQEQHQLHQHRQDHGVRRRRRAFDPSNNAVPAVLNPANPVMALHRDAGGRAPAVDLVRQNGQWTINGHDLGRRGAPATSRCSLADPQTGDVEIWEIAQHVGRLVPPRPHPPHRLQGPRPQRQATAARTSSGPRTWSTSARTRRCGVLIKFEQGRGQVHDPLPQPGPRGPRHDGPVRGASAPEAGDDPMGDPCKTLSRTTSEAAMTSTTHYRGSGSGAGPPP